MDLRLYEAATTGSVDLFKKLANENLNLLLEVTPLNNTVLHLAVKLGHEDLVKEVCEQCESLLAKRNSKGDTALHIAARDGHLSIVNILVEKSISGSTSIDLEGGNPTNNIMRIQNQRNDTILHEALRYGYSDVAKVLTEKDPELWCFVNEVGESPLYLAVKGGLTEIAREVLESSKPYAHGGPNRLTALHATVLEGHHDDITKLIVEKKPELIKEKDIYGRTALHYAASYYGRIDEAKLLLESDSSVAYIQDNDGRSPLHFAAGKGYTRIIEEIIGRYPDAADLVDNRGQNAFHVCIKKFNENSWWEPTKVFDCLTSKVRHNELLNQQDNDGNTPLHLAVMRGLPRLVKSVLESNGRVDTDILNKNNLTPMDLTSPRKDALKEEVEVLVKLGSAHAKCSIAEPFNRRRWVTNRRRWVTIDQSPEKAKISAKEFSSNHLMVVATLIATVTFAAAFQVPGGYQSDGRATLAREAAFEAFVIADAIALTCSMTAVILCFRVITTQDFTLFETASKRFFQPVPNLIVIAITAMLVAFMAGLYAVLTNSLWLAIFTCFIVLGIILLGTDLKWWTSHIYYILWVLERTALKLRACVVNCFKSLSFFVTFLIKKLD